MRATLPPCALLAVSTFVSIASAQVDAGPFGVDRVAFPAGADFNTSVAAAIGDVNADGVPDFALGDRFAGSLFRSGTLWVYSGANRSLLYTVEGTVRDGWFGSTITAMGDVNQDGLDDFAVASWKTPAVTLISGMDGSEIHTIAPGGTASTYGQAMLRLPDIDGDGADEVAIGSTRFSSGGLSRNGVVRVHSGATGAQLADLFGELDDQNFGASLTLVGDQNGDGAPDFVVGATFERPGFGSLRDGALYAYDGRTLQLLWRADDIIQEMGWQLASLGDLDRDGVDDLWTTGISEMAVVSGATQTSLLSLTIDRSQTLTTFPDLDGDEIDELAYGQPFATDPNGSGLWHGSLVLLSGADLSTEVTPVYFSHAGARAGTTLASLGAVGMDDTPVFVWSELSASSAPNELILAGFRRNLRTSQSSLSIQQGGTIDFEFSFTAALAGERWQLLGSTTTPARVFVPGGGVPLSVGGVLWNAMLSNNPPSQFSRVRGTLNPAGRDATTFTWNPGDVPRLAGRSLWFSAVAIDSNGNILANSVAAQIRFLP